MALWEKDDMFGKERISPSFSTVACAMGGVKFISSPDVGNTCGNRQVKDLRLICTEIMPD